MGGRVRVSVGACRAGGGVGVQGGVRLPNTLTTKLTYGGMLGMLLGCGVPGNPYFD